MKKYLIKQAKKSLSLLLAVVMLMSCWVWVAPEKAEAGTISADNYKVEINFTIMHTDYDGGNIQYRTSGNGWGTQSANKIYINSFDAEGCKKQGTYTKSFTTTDFPTYIYMETTGGGGGACGTDARMEVNWIKINGKQVWTGPAGWNKNNKCEIYPTNDAGDAGNWSGTYEWPKPMIQGFTEASATGKTDAINLTLNKVGGQNVSGATSFDLSKYTFYDQYGKQIADGDKATFLNNNRFSGATTTTTHIAKNENSEDVTEYSSDIWVNPNNADGVVVSPNLQINNPQGSIGGDTFYLVRTYKVKDIWDGEQTSKVSAKINVTYPKYTVNFNAGLSSAKITVGNETKTGEYSASNVHGGNITLPGETTAEGYTFYGYWSNPQPTTGDASYNALTANFAEPCTTEDYTAYKEMEGATVENGIVTDPDGNRWYDAGKKLDSSTHGKIDVEGNVKTPNDTSDDLITDWYGYWLSKDLTVKFYDVDGTFLGEKTVKSGQTQSDITWPTSKYIDSGYTTGEFISGAFKFKVDGNIWENTDGTEINKTSYTFTKDLILTPKLTRESFTDKYAVSFINPNNGNSVSVGSEGGIYNYRQNITDRANEAKGKIDKTPSDVDGDIQYSYELLGWSSVKPTTGKNYHVLLEDADFDVNGTSIGLNSDWVVRSEATYYAVYRRHTKTYVVNFNYKDATGSEATRQLKVKYGATLVPPTDYVPYTYVTKGFGYTFKEWGYSSSAGDATLGYAATIPFTSEYISIQGAALDDGTNVNPIKIDATYGDPVATPYTVTFNYVDDKGEDVSKNVEVKNEQFILQGTVDALNPAEKWDHEDQLYTYANKWEITEGAATVGVGGAEKKVGDIIDTADLTSLTPTSNLTFKAVYANPVPFYTVTYIDGKNTKSFRILKDSNVPAWTNKVTNDDGVVEDKIYVPADYEGNGGTYEFQGWYDQKQTDDTFQTTNGNKVTTADKVAGNLTLYSQFKFVPDTFNVKFVSHDGKTVFAEADRVRGADITDLIEDAEADAALRAGDETYTYLFLGWDKEVPSFCEGYDVIYTAQYKPVYKYYNVKWYNSRLVNGKWVADKSTSEVDGKTVETYLLATTHHTYNSKLYTPSVDNLACLEAAPEGQNYVFAGWYYNDAEGNAHKYERGMFITAEMEFYATYTLTEKVYTVTTVVKGVETKYSVASGDTVSIPDPQAGYVDAEKHDAFDGWYTDAECTAKFDTDTEITADTKIYAKFTEGEHDFTGKAVKTVPTYYAKGEMELWCSCDETETKKTEEIPMLTDTKVPTGTIYLGDKSWSSEGEAANVTDNDDISIFVNEDTDVIITSNDTGGCNCGEEGCTDCANDALYNPSGIGMGVKYIRAFAFPADTVLTSDNFGAAQELAIDVYVDETEALTNNANFAVKLGDFIVADLNENDEVQYDAEGNIKYKSLESGESYIIYYYVVDKAGNQLNTKVRTAKFIYDNTAPAFTLEGKSNGAAIPTYCGEAKVTGIEKDVVLKVNNTVVEVNYADDVTTGTYEINYTEGVDNVIITATDKAGNSFSKKIKLAEHSYLLTKQEATCGVEGYEKEECIICGDVKTDETYPALDHIWSDRQVIEADCVNIGSVVVTCEICGETVTTQYDEDGEAVIPALGHKFAKDENDEIIYTTVTESTCKTKGLGEAYCTECNGELEGGYITTELALNPENHEDITVTELLPDCINNGYYTEACSCGVTIEHKDHETDPDDYAVKGHGETAWEIIKEATCCAPGTMVEKCTVCTDIITAETAYGYTEDAEGNFAYVTKTEGEGEDATEVKVTEEIDGKTYYKYYLVPATGEHVLVIKNRDTDVKEPAVGEAGFIKWSCSTEGCTYTKTDDYEALEGFTVTFKTEDGKTVLKEEKDVVSGTMIGKDYVTAPEKAATKTETYTFAGWKDAEGNTVKLPLTVTKDLVLTATYRATKILYTHQFLVPTTWTTTLAEEGNTVEFATLIGTYGVERVPSGTPVFTHKDADEDARLKALYTFEFKGWKNTKGEIVTDFTVSGDATFEAYFEAKAIQHEVLFYNGDKVIHTATVDAGAAAKYNKYDDKGTEDTSDDVLIVPEKDYDDAYHYSFSDKWYTDPACTEEYKGEAITGKTRLYAGFIGTAHTLVEIEKDENGEALTWAATCTEAGQKTEKCECGYVKTTAIDALEHDFENGETVESDITLADGTVIKAGSKLCVRYEDCGAYELPEAEKFTVTLNDKVTNVAAGEAPEGKIAAAEIEEGEGYEFTAPEKTSTDKYTFTFVNWTDAEGNEISKNEKLVLENVTADAVYTANYTATVRKYTVTYADVDGNPVDQQAVNYGSAVPAAPAAPVREVTESIHFTFTEWKLVDGKAGDTVTSNMLFQAQYKAESHNFEKTGATSTANCTQGGGEVHKCTVCDFETVIGGTSALGHKYKETGRDEPTYEAEGTIYKECTVCGDKTTTTIPKREYKYITVTVKNADGALVEGAKVDLYRDGGDWVAANYTNVNGVVTFKVGDENYKYTVLVSGVDGLENQEIEVGAGDNTVDVEKPQVTCSCSCHRPGFWGMVFRFFHKIISWFTGRISCCSCPDSKY